jgi:hypothetical protein
MPKPWNEHDALAVCRRFRDTAPTETIFPEPYLPYVPSDWNGILVLAEAQHLAVASTYRVFTIMRSVPLKTLRTNCCDKLWREL